jgi:hypothetical protein
MSATTPESSPVGCKLGCQNVLKGTMVYTRTRIVLLDGATWNADPRNLAVRNTRIGFNRAEADTAHSEDSLHKRTK